jgi:hypothetical protein
MTTTRRRVRRLASAASVAGACAATYVAVATGRATVDLGVGRRSASLGPLTVDVRAPRELVFEVISAPYLGRAGPAGGHIEVVSRGSDLVVAAHRTPLAGRIVATTVEAVGFDRPREVTFRLLRGPVPSMQERFLLEETEEGTRVHTRRTAAPHRAPTNHRSVSISPS